MPDRIRDRVEKCLDGSATPGQQRDVVAAASASGALRASIVDDLLFDAVLTAAGHDVAEFERNVMARLTRHQSRDAFTEEMTERFLGNIVSGREGRKRRFPTWARLAAAASILACVGLLGLLVRNRFRSEPGIVIAEVVEQRVTESIKGRGWSWSNLNVGDKILAGMTVRTGTDGRLRYRYIAEDTVMTLREKSTLKIEQPGQHHLARGRLIAKVTKADSPGRKSFLVTTPQAEVTVLGTRFQLTVDDTMTRLAVTEGLVQLVSLLDREAVRVPAGHGVDVVPGEELNVKALPTNVVYHSDFKEVELDPFWETVDPAGQVTVGALPGFGMLTLRASDTRPDGAGTDAPRPRVEMTSRLIPLEGKALEILVPYLGVQGSPGAGGRRLDSPPVGKAFLQLLHGGDTLCSLESGVFSHQKRLQLRVGARRNERRIAVTREMGRDAFRFIIAPEGDRIAIHAQGVHTQGAGPAIIRQLPEPVEDVRVRIAAETLPGRGGETECSLWSLTIRRLPDWPEELSGMRGSIPGTVFEDHFEGPHLGSSWQCKQDGSETSGNGITFQESWLLLQAGKDSRGRDLPRSIELLSRPIPVEGSRVRLTFQADEVDVSGGNGCEYGVELLDENGQRICLAHARGKGRSWWDQNVLLPEGADTSSTFSKAGHIPYLPDIDIRHGIDGRARFGDSPNVVLFKPGGFESVQIRIFAKAAPGARLAIPIDKVIVSLDPRRPVAPASKTP